MGPQEHLQHRDQLNDPIGHAYFNSKHSCKGVKLVQEAQ